ncbi:dimethyl sulfoxide reductase anchor subunit family protein [Neptunicoccus sediminis]|uniref:dimethyl sulfoxide reductase anchor subunit family protein n=1 Tax=Neptunicoccus sediminis TaxID=1892596 RepID=UPI00084618F2|nr:DmsC/YnfH family molybdoenzyme membrane anchor subunit [Neptunicoccus sediminis]
MHPAPSVIVFTALSGLGFGLLAFLGVNVPDVTGMTAFIFFFIAYALAVGGLVASTFHLGNPQRALKAFTQWRSSWLSREGVFAVLSLCVMGIYAACLIFLDLRLPVVGIIGSILSLISVYCTSMIYGQLKTVPRWNQPLTPVLFLAYALTGGALLSGQVYLAAGLMVLLMILQYAHWTIGDGRLAAAGGTIEAATGLGHLGKVRLLESPHSGTNYLLREMAHEVGRKHAFKLRVIALLCLGVLPCLLLLLTAPGHLSALVAVLLHLVGVFAARWLFFAEAEHVQALYYDRHRAA